MGSYGSVRKARSRKNTKQVVAVKTIPKKRYKGNFDSLKKELNLLKLLDHPNIIKFYETY